MSRQLAKMRLLPARPVAALHWLLLVEGWCTVSMQAAAAGKDVPWMAAHCGHVLVPAHHEVFVVDDLHKDARWEFIPPTDSNAPHIVLPKC